ncbi:MAG: hypothetical protein ABSA30_10140, partial [Candidatus Aminicenantales bacterium]
GVWQWDTKKGWFWIPGSSFAPAWVDWAFFGGSVLAWRPWSMWDWGWSEYPSMFADWFMDPLFGWCGGWFLGWGFGGPGGAYPDLRTISKGRLKPFSRPPFDMPEEFRVRLKSLMEGLGRHDPAAVESLLAVGRQAVAVDLRLLNSPDVGEKSAPLAGLLGIMRFLPLPDAAKALLSAPHLASDRAALLASQQFAFNQRRLDQAEQRARLQNGELLPASPRAYPPALRSLNPPMPARYLDWNPDIRLAAKLGVDVRYASASNEIYSPQLAISSSTVHTRGIMDGGMGNSRGGSSARGASAGSGGSGGAASGAAEAAGTTGSASTVGGSSGHIR